MSERRIVVWVQHFADREYLMLQWHDPDTGKRKSKSAGTNNPIQAEKIRVDLEYELNNGLYKEASGMPWEKFRELFEDEYLAGLRTKTRQKYETVFTVFEEVINPGRLRTITERTVSKFVQGMRERKNKRGRVGMAPYSIKNYLIALKTTLRWAKDQHLLAEVPKFPRVKVPKKKPQPVPAESFEKLLEKAPDAAWRAYLLCGWWSGLRLNEAYSLRWEPSEELPWGDFQRNRIVLPAVFVKSDEDQWVPLHTVLREALEALPRTGPRVFNFTSRRGGPLSANGVSNRVLALAKKAGVKLSMHRLRKGFGCRVAKQLGKGQAPVLHELMRHSSMQVTMDFYASVDDVLQEAISELT
jgi:integrase